MCPACKHVDSRVSEGRLTSTIERFKNAGKWLLPSAMLAFMPKCPMCVVAYVAIASGFGISASTATLLRTGLIVLCVLSLLLMAARQIHRFVTLAPIATTHEPDTL